MSRYPANFDGRYIKSAAGSNLTPLSMMIILLVVFSDAVLFPLLLLEIHM